MLNILLFILTISLSMSSYAYTIDYIPDEHPNSRYSVHNNGTVTDEITGLMWKRCSQGQTWESNTCTNDASTHNWQEALEQAENYTFANHSDWRLPNIKEFKSIAAYNRFGPSINEDIFPNILYSSDFWSSSPDANDGLKAWQLSFENGTGYNYDRQENNHVRLVRLGW